MPFPNGPYLTAAALCERVLEEKDGVLSLVRVIDRINVQINLQGTLVPPLVPELPVYPLTLVVSLKSGQQRGSLPLKVRVLTPSGLKWPEIEVTVLFEGDDDRGTNLIVPMRFGAQEEGLFWFVVELGGEVLTRIPLRVVRQTTSQTTPPQL